MKILLLSHYFYPAIGGIETMSLVLANGLHEAGHKVTVLTWTKNDKIEAFPFKVVRCPSVKTTFKLFCTADLIFENNPCIRLGWLGLIVRKPTLVVLHTWIKRPDGRQSLTDYLKRHLWLKSASKVVAVSSLLRTKCYPSAQVISNCYQDATFKVINDGSRPIPFVFLGRLVHDKGADVVLRALKLLTDLDETLITSAPLLTIIGEGPEMANLRQIVRELDIAPKVQFSGTLTGASLVQCLNQHRFILVPSRWEEPFGLVAIEGMACGCVPVVADSGSLPEIIGKAGFVFKRNDANDLACLLHQLMTKGELVESVMRAGQEHKQLFTHRNMINQYLDLVQQLVAH